MWARLLLFIALAVATMLVVRNHARARLTGKSHAELRAARPSQP
jgi:hypothetical protein